MSQGPKVAVIVEHFRTNVRRERGGRAKVMVVTGSRLEAVRDKRAIDRYRKDHKLEKELGALVTFSGSVDDPDSGVTELTETILNLGLKGRALDKAIGGDEFQVMTVANKFLTGFDQPLFVGMYVDKILSPTRAADPSRTDIGCPSGLTRECPSANVCHLLLTFDRWMTPSAIVAPPSFARARPVHNPGGDSRRLTTRW
ncbi:hypothetical protein [Rhodoglobus vestalii]|uniref:hypothetical protein n=1 Tax=Rhodoglobus vestalii TaxID=193384 RepID=UPI0011507656|nr:hypothetical protein [Rhodoglobus vestalii]